MIVVADAGPLIYLSAVGQLHLLRDLYTEILVPRAVHDEVVVHGHGLAGSAEVASAEWIRLSSPMLGTALQQSLLSELDAGEAEAIALAVEEHADLVLLDERRGRRVALRLGLRVRGTLGVLVEAKARGHLRLVGPILDQLTAAGFRVTEAVRAEILKRADE